MTNWIFFVYFWIFAVFCLVHAVVPNVNDIEPVSNDEVALISDQFSHFYVGGKEMNTMEPAPGCFGNIFSSSPKIPKCLEADTAQFLNIDMKNNFSEIARGVDGVVYKFKRPSDKNIVAVKMRHKKDKLSKHDFLREVRLLWKCRGEGFTAKIDCIFQDNAQNMYYMMEYLPGKTLRDVEFYNPRTDNFNLKWADVCLKMATIIVKLNAKKVGHYDIHLGNWIVTADGRLYIIDFSRSRETGFLYDKTTDAEMLGNAFDEIVDKMLLPLGKHLGINSSNTTELRAEVPEDLVDQKGIEKITKILQVKDPEERGKVVHTIHHLKDFIKRHQV